MRNDFRAKQFLPFDSLNGFNKLIYEMEEERHEKILTSEDDIMNLNNILVKLKKGDRILVKYFDNFRYLEVIGIVKKVDNIYKILYLNDCKILFDDILNIVVSNSV